MATDTVYIKAKDALSGGILNVGIMGFGKWAIRVWIGMQLIRLAAWIMGLDGIEYDGLE